MRIAVFLALALLLTAAVAPRVSSPVAAAECDPNYSDCVPISSADLDCEDIDGPVQVLGNDRHRLDADKDGVACEEGASGSGSTNGGNGPANGANGAGNCTQVFVAGKGQVDSCSGERKATSRVYPRKPGVPAEGCINACPEVPAAAEAKPTGTPAPTNRPTGAANPDNAPVDTEYTPPIASGATPAPTNCDRVSYPDVCIPAAPPYLSCSDIPDRNFRVRAPDPHRFDADGNGIGCEEVRSPTIGR